MLQPVAMRGKRCLPMRTPVSYTWNYRLKSEISQVFYGKSFVFLPQITGFVKRYMWPAPVLCIAIGADHNI